MFKKFYFSLVLVFLFGLVLTGCQGDTKDENSLTETEKEISESKEDESNGEAKEDSVGGEQEMKNPIVTISVKIGETELGEMKIELYPDKAPNTVANFITLAQDGYYDGLIFHRIIKDFMIQGGDPTGTGMGGPGYGIKGEFKANGFENDLKHERGIISMARSSAPDSAGSQFFICHADAPHLDGQYAAFGRLIEGESVLDELGNTATGAQDRPVEDCVMTKVTVDLSGYELPEVEKAN